MWFVKQTYLPLWLFCSMHFCCIRSLISLCLLPFSGGWWLLFLFSFFCVCSNKIFSMQNTIVQFFTTIDSTYSYSDTNFSIMTSSQTLLIHLITSSHVPSLSNIKLFKLNTSLNEEYILLVITFVWLLTWTKICIILLTLSYNLVSTMDCVFSSYVKLSF